jgi:hypothetical protein
MLRPGWFSLRVLVITAASFGILAPASFAQAVSLDGESLESTLTVPGQQTTFDNFTCDKAGTTSVNFTTQGSAFGPYSGTFVETGSFTIGPQIDRASTPAAWAPSPPSKRPSQSTAPSPWEP